MPICKRNRKKSWLKIVLQSFSQRMIINDPISSSCRSRSFRMVSIRCKMMMREKARHEHSSSTSLLVTTFGINYEETNEQQSRSLHFYPPCVTLQSILTTARVKGSFLRSLLRFLRSMMQEEEGHDQHITNQVYTTGKISTTTTNHLLLLLLLGEKSGPLGPAGIPTQAQDRLLDYRKKKRKSKKKWPRTSHCWPLVRHCPTRDNKKKDAGIFRERRCKQGTRRRRRRRRRYVYWRSFRSLLLPLHIQLLPSCSPKREGKERERKKMQRDGRCEQATTLVLARAFQKLHGGGGRTMLKMNFPLSFFSFLSFFKTQIYLQNAPRRWNGSYITLLLFGTKSLWPILSPTLFHIGPINLWDWENGSLENLFLFSCLCCCSLTLFCFVFLFEGFICVEESLEF